MARTLLQARICHSLHPSVSPLAPALSLSLCYDAMCLGGARGRPLGLHHGSPLCLSVCPSVCLSSQASCVTALHPVSSAPVLTGHRQSWSPLTASSPHSVSPTTAPGPQHCHRGRPPACPPARPPTLWPLEPNAGPRGPEDSSGPSPPARPPAHQELTLSGSYVTAQPPALPVRRASGACSGKRSKTWSHVVSQSC